MSKYECLNESGYLEIKDSDYIDSEIILKIVQEPKESTIKKTCSVNISESECKKIILELASKLDKESKIEIYHKLFEEIMYV